MKKSCRIIGAILAASMLLSATACQKTEEKKSRRKSDKDKKRTEQTEEPEETEETTAEVTEETTEETTEATTTEETTEATTEATTAETTEDIPVASDLDLLIDVPATNCKIKIPDEKRPQYKMDLTLDTEEQTIGGHVEYTFTNYSKDNWDKLCFRDYSSLFTSDNKDMFMMNPQGDLTEIKNITDHRYGIEIDYTRDTDVSVVWVDLDGDLKPGEEMTISYDFVAKIPAMADRYGYTASVYNITNFYPIMAMYDDDGGWSHEAFYTLGECFYSVVSDYDVDLTVPENMIVLSTGVEKDESKKDGQKTISYEATCVRDFVFSASNSFTITEGDYKDTHIRIAYKGTGDPEDLTGTHALKCATDSLAVFGEAFGEYPYPDLEVILAPIDAGGMEYPNLVQISYDYVPGLSEDDLEDALDIVIAHEIGHQWFMGIVGSNSGNEPWLDESLASFTEFVYEKYANPTIASHELQDVAFYITSDDIKEYEESSGVTPINKPYYDFKTDIAYIEAAYSTGKCFYMHMCNIIGYEEMLGILREYVHRTAFTNATEDDLFDTIYDCIGTDNEKANEFIDQIFDYEMPNS